MANYARLCSVEYIYENTIIDNNVDAKLITKFIDESQDLYIQQAIGYNMYQILMNMVATNSFTLAYLDLLTNYIQRCQAHYVVYGMLPYLNYHLTNKSVNTKSSEFSQPSGLKELEYLRNDAKSKAEFYVARIREQIVNNPGDYPDYWTTSGIDRINPKAKNYSNMVWLPQVTRIPSGTNVSNDGQGYPCSGGYFM